MTRFTFTPNARRDVEKITRYLRELPSTPALKIGRELQNAIEAIITRPGLGRIDEHLTGQSEEHILRYNCGQYILFYTLVNGSVRIVGVLHGRRDIGSILRKRLE